jgi:serine/threonine protein kinase
MNHPENQVMAIFAEAMEIADARARKAFLGEACGGDRVLRKEVEELLQAEAHAGGFLRDKPQDPGVHLGIDFSALPLIPHTEKIGDRIGPYKLLQKIGEGGCGNVYMAEQEQPVRRKVALKVIKLGMDTRSVIARFQAERQALALMEHPNIAKVLDAGATETGRPYFVMELVRGVKITDYCDESNLTARERLGLFVQVCQAIQHAHQKGIIHRDIKPSNILVTVNDGVAVPKVIDFGIAKATQGRLTEQTLFTAFEQFIGTPAYMSPEQAVMTSLDVDTRSDIYSLGVLLYELLTGSTPFDQKDLLSAGLDEMRRTIREREPPLPSTRLGALPEEKLTTAASRRQLEPLKLIRLLRGDLEWIVMKCIEKDRAHRYDTVNGLATDVQRYLADEPILARPPGKLYRFQKLVRRNKLLFAASGAVAGALVTGLAVSMWLLHKEREAVTAETLARKGKEQSVEFLRELLLRLSPIIATNRDMTKLNEALDGLVWQVQPDLVNSPELRHNLYSTIALVCLDFGEDQKAEDMARQSVAILRKGARQGSGVSVEPLRVLRDVLMDEHKFEEAREIFKGPLATELGLQSENTQFLRIRAEFRARTGDWQAAVADYSELVKLEPDDHENYYSLAPLLVQTGNRESYEGFRHQILAHFGGDTNDSNMVHRMARSCLILPASGRELEAATSLADLSATLGKGLINQPWCLFTKGLAEYRLGRYASTVDWMQKVLQQKVVRGQGRRKHLRVQTYALLAMARQQLNQPEEARAALAEAAKIMQAEMERSRRTGAGRGEQGAAVVLMEKEGPKLEGGDMTSGWKEWLIAHSFMKEAEDLIQSQTSSH